MMGHSCCVIVPEVIILLFQVPFASCDGFCHHSDFLFFELLLQISAMIPGRGSQVMHLRQSVIQTKSSSNSFNQKQSHNKQRVSLK